MGTTPLGVPPGGRAQAVKPALLRLHWGTCPLPEVPAESPRALDTAAEDPPTAVKVPVSFGPPHFQHLSGGQAGRFQLNGRRGWLRGESYGCRTPQACRRRNR